MKKYTKILNPKAREIYHSDTKLKRRWRAIVKAAEAGNLSNFRKALPDILSSSVKTIKSLKVKALTGILYLSPHMESGYNQCPHATTGCILSCLGHSSGHMRILVGGGVGNAMRARILRTWALPIYREMFHSALKIELQNLERRAAKKGFRPFARLNGTSDRPWEKTDVMGSFPATQFYDYTKNEKRASAWAEARTGKTAIALSTMGNRMAGLENYHLTFSRSENNQDACNRLRKKGVNVAVVFDKTPKSWRGSTVANGDETDARPDDGRGQWIGLTAKGAAKRDATGFKVVTK